MYPSLLGKTVVVTGATSGIGFAIAEQLVEQGAFVIGVGRSEERCEQAQAHLRSLSGDVQAVCLTADLSLQSSVRKVAAEIREVVNNSSSKGLYALVNNAGTFRYWLTLTLEGFELQWAVNHLAPFLLTHELLPLLKQSTSARVVMISSGSHRSTHLHWDDIQLRRKYNGLLAYKQTKLANVLFTAEFNRRVDTGVRAFAADPGLVNTDIGAKSDSFIARWVWSMRRRGGISADESARAVVFLVTKPSIQNSEAIYWSHGNPKPPSNYALDPYVARRLWDLSEKMCAMAPGGFLQ